MRSAGRRRHAAGPAAAAGRPGVTGQPSATVRCAPASNAAAPRSGHRPGSPLR